MHTHTQKTNLQRNLVDLDPSAALGVLALNVVACDRGTSVIGGRLPLELDEGAVAVHHLRLAGWVRLVWS